MDDMETTAALLLKQAQAERAACRSADRGPDRNPAGVRAAA